MSDARRRAAQLQARQALDEVTDCDPEMIFLDEYQTSYSGNSITATLSHRFADHHGLGTKEPLYEFFDSETGALVILPKRVAEPEIVGE